MGMRLKSSSRISHALGLVFRFPKNTSFNGRILYILLLALVKFVSDSKLNRYERAATSALATDRKASCEKNLLPRYRLDKPRPWMHRRIRSPTAHNAPRAFGDVPVREKLAAPACLDLQNPRVWRVCQTVQRARRLTLARKLQMLGLSYAVMGVSAFFMRNVIAWTVLGAMALFLAWLAAVRIPTISNEEAAAASYPTATMRPSDEITSI